MTSSPSQYTDNGWALVTGASSGIGLEIARQLAARDINLILTATNKAKLTVVEKELKDQVKTLVYATDLSELDSPKQLYDFIQSHKITVSYLVNNAGFGDYGPFSESDTPKQQAIINLNIGSLTILTRLFLPAMVKQGNCYVLNVASTAAFFPGPLMAVYYATKAYVLRFSLAVNEELKGSGVSVTALCPGPTKTSFAKAAQATKSPVFSGKLPTAKQVAKVGVEAMLERKPVVVEGWRNKLITSLSGLIPVSLQARLVSKAQRSG